MWDQIVAFFCALAGSNPPHINPAQACFRAVVIYALAILIVRCGDRRMFGRSTVFDAVIGFILGSTLSRAINGSAPFWASVAAGAALVAMHFAISALTYRFPTLERWVKGQPRQLIRDGQPQHGELARLHISAADLSEELRRRGKAREPAEVRDARLESNGEVSVIPAKHVEILEVKVAAGVQTVRLQVSSK